MGTGADHGVYDVYLDGSLWQSFDGYQASASERDIVIPLETDSRKLSKDGLHVLEIRVRAERHPSSSGNQVRFKQLVMADQGYNLHTIRYNYDRLARLREARYAPSLNGGVGDGDLLRRYQYAFDLSGNRTQQIVTIAGSATTTNYSYNTVNQLTSDGTNTLTYDNNGNLTHDGATAYTWDRANRMLSAGGTSYAYDGLSNRISQTVSSITTSYLLDLQPGLAVMLGDSDGNHYVHAPRGIHAQQNNVGDWQWMIQDGLGSVRGVIDDNFEVLESRLYAPYGGVFGTSGHLQTGYGFTGEQYDASTDLLYLRARYYAPSLGMFTSSDLLENLNRYAYADGDPVNRVDPNGLQSATLADPNGGFGGSIAGGGDAFWAILLGLVTAHSIAGSQISPPSIPWTHPQEFPGIRTGENPFDAPIEWEPVREPPQQNPQLTPTPTPPQPNWLGQIVTALVGGTIGLELWRLVQDGGCPQPQPQLDPIRVATPVATATATPEPKYYRFGQVRIAPHFSSIGDTPNYLSGKALENVAAELQSGVLNTSQIRLDVFERGNELVALNNRALAVLSMAQTPPTNVRRRQPTVDELNRLQDYLRVPSRWGIPGNTIRPPSHYTAVTTQREGLDHRSPDIGWLYFVQVPDYFRG